MLATDTCAFVLRKTSQTLMARIQSIPLQQQSMSVVTLAELLYGVQVSSGLNNRVGTVLPTPTFRGGLSGGKRP